MDVTAANEYETKTEHNGTRSWLKADFFFHIINY